MGAEPDWILPGNGYIQRGAKTLTHLTAGSFETNQEDFREVADKPSLRYKQNLVEKRMNHDEGHEDTFYMELNHFIKAFGTMG